MRNPLDKLISYLAPVTCAACGREGLALCPSCKISAGDSLPERCAGCRKLSKGSKTCKSCKSWLKVSAVHVSNDYEGVYERLVESLKFNFQREVASTVAELLPKLGDEYEDWTVVALPTAPARVRTRGFDHAKLIAKEYASINSLVHKDLLGRKSNVRQVGASRAKRLQQMEEEFYAKTDCTSLRIILIDDLVTTGASVSSAAKTLRAAGAKRVEAVVFAQKS